MTLIRIDRSSIKKNPKAGNTKTVAQVGPREVNFTYRGVIPNYLKNADEHSVVILNELKGSAGQPPVYEGCLPVDYGAIFNLLMKDKNASIEVRSGMGVIDHMPEKEYFYKYENPQLECLCCHKVSALNDISYEDDGDGDQDYACPKCGEFNMFKLEFEHIVDAIKNIKNENLNN